MRQRIENTEGLMLDGKILNPEDIEAIINAVRVGLEMAKLRNKEKYELRNKEKYGRKKRNNDGSIKNT
ncbi:hypothetical protein L1766_01220 [Thermovorax subterraneus]|nr:hypothetical protein [Thermovorax subterraneus]